MPRPYPVSSAQPPLFRNLGVLTLLLVLVFLFGFASAGYSQAPSEAGPVLTKEQKKALDGPGRNAAKHCSGDTGKHRGETISGCIELAAAMRNQLKDVAGARQALERACALGSDNGCTQLGKDFQAAGDIAAARNAWSAPACNFGSSCRAALFDSYATATPVDLANAERVGLPMCDAGGDEEMCRKLWKLGSRANFAAIMNAHSEQRQQRIEELTQKAEQADSDAASDKSQYEQYDAQAKAQNGTPDGLGASLKSLIYATSYRSDVKQAAAYREEIKQLKSQDFRAHQASANPWQQSVAAAQ